MHTRTPAAPPPGLPPHSAAQCVLPTLALQNPQAIQQNRFHLSQAAAQRQWGGMPGLGHPQAQMMMMGDMSGTMLHPGAQLPAALRGMTPYPGTVGYPGGQGVDGLADAFKGA